MCDRRNPIQCIIPPHMLEAIVERGSEKLRAAALKAIKVSNHLRQLRSDVLERSSRDAMPGTSGADAYSPERVRLVYDAENDEALPGKLVRREGDGSTGLPAVDEAFDGAGDTWDLYREEYGRNSLDDNGMEIVQTVRYGEQYNNAFWNGEQMVYGDGDGELFNRFTIDPDIIGHELSHGVIQHSAALRYWYQSGALNESFADVFGSLVKQRRWNQEANEADWLVGANVLIGDSYALRSLEAPGTAYENHPIIGDDPQTATMDDYLTLPPWEDNGGVHLNSGIPNHAFYLAAIEIGGYAWLKPGLVWYRALTERLGRNTSFASAARATIAIAREEFGVRSLEEQAVERAWKSVKVL